MTDRYIKTFAIKNTQKQLVPFWLAQFVETDDDVYYKFENDWHKYYFLEEVLWDTKKGRIKQCFSKRDNQPTKFEVGQKIGYEKDYLDKIIHVATITRIFYGADDETPNDIALIKASKLDEDTKKLFTKEELESLTPNELIEFRIYFPIFELDNGEIIEQTYRMYKVHDNT